jgi:Kef-type K+ transport system membrane component KefB
MPLYIELAVILILAKIFSDLSSRIKQPPVLGLLLLGIVLGPSVTGFLHSSEIVKVIGEIGVFILLFMAGLETDIQKMIKEGPLSFTVASCGVGLPFLAGLGLTLFFGYGLPRALLLGTILTATSVSVTVMTLWDIKRLDTLEGRTILGAAIIDDVMGIIVLTIISALIGSQNAHIMTAIGKLVLFFIISIFMGLLIIRPYLHVTKKLKSDHAPLAIAIGLMFVFAWLAQVCGLAAITGAYAAGLLVGNTSLKREVLHGFNIIGQAFFIAIFFVNIGLEASFQSIHSSVLFVTLFILAAILTKIVGCTLGAKAFRLSNKESLRIGVGMVPRAEVALAVASIGLAQNIITRSDFSMTVLLCLTTAMVTPVLLRLTFKDTIPATEAQEAIKHEVLPEKS